MQPLPWSYLVLCIVEHGHADQFQPESTLAGENSSRLQWAHIHIASFGTILAATTLCAGFVVILVLVCAVAGLAVPLLAMLPSASAAVLAIQAIVLVEISEFIPVPLKALSAPLKLPRSDSVLACSILLLAAVWLARRARVYLLRKSLRQSSEFCCPHGLSRGTWELRALGFLAFPLTASSTQILLNLDRADSPLAGFLFSTVLLCFLVNQAASALLFVRDVLRDGCVIRAALPKNAGGGEVFIDRLCDELRAIPSRAWPSQPGQFGQSGAENWLATSTWCFSHSVARVMEVELAEEDLTCRNEQLSPYQAMSDCCEDDLQGKPLLRGEVVEDSCELDASPEAASEAFALPEAPAFLFRGGVSAVKLSHPATVSITQCYGVQGKSLAGVVCIPWLDCAVPSDALCSIEDLCGTVTLRVHPAQLTGRLSSGQYAPCFDWGTRLPWRWPMDFALQLLLGIWMGIRSRQILPAAELLVDSAMLCMAAILMLFMCKVSAWDHWIDNAALRASYMVVLHVVFIRATWDPAKPTLCILAAGGAALFAMIPLLTLLSAGVCLLGIALGQLESHQREERLLHDSVTGWAPGAVSQRQASFDFPACDLRLPQGQDAQDVEIVLDGQVVGIEAPVLPGRARVRIRHVQLISLHHGPQVLPCASSDRGRLPLPHEFLFPSALINTTARTSEERAVPAGIVPAAALLTPGYPGKLVYSEACYNGASWQDAITCYFVHMPGLAEEAICQVDAAQRKSRHPCVVIVEVLPAIAAAFVDAPDERGAEEDA
ncbi:unnamed protein product [Effrenium voratum]|uniref:Uncharacterized protein n=1 Tax=Effrenium voratum TaxID=2562239 RepID=A0AA36IAH9_9DINO|nr:unnamed protein product [Effrenium voratum]